MSDKRREEIEKKRAKLAALRQQRQDRQRSDLERRQAGGQATPEVRSLLVCVISHKHGFQISGTSRRDIDDLVSALVGGTRSQTGVDSSDFTPSSSIPGTPAMGHPSSLPVQTAFGSGRVSRQSDFHERASALVGTTSSATDHVIER
jgi:dynein intermediate chain